jgi:hypothetical protein
MPIKLSDTGRTHVTRERARDIIAAAGPLTESADVVVDAEGVIITPSFVAELLTALTARGLSVRFVNASEHTAKLVESLTGKLKLTGRVTVVEAAAAR